MKKIIYLILLISISGFAANNPGFVTVKLKVADGQACVIGGEVESNRGGNPWKHFVSPKVGIIDNPNVVTLEAEVDWHNTDYNSASEAFAAEFQWVGGDPVLDEPLKRTVSRANAGKVEVKITKKDDESRVKGKIKVWIVWSTSTAKITKPLNFQHGILNCTPPEIIEILNIAIPEWGVVISGSIEVEFTIVPESIFTDTDRPVLNGLTSQNLVPQGEMIDLLTGLSYKTGADYKWDVSRQVTSKIVNANLVAQELFMAPPNVTYFYNQPLANHSYKIQPQLNNNTLWGNDDAGTKDEHNIPYGYGGKIFATDAPIVGFSSGTGLVGDIVEQNLQFKEFSRLEINGCWYNISDFVPWQLKTKVTYKQAAFIHTGDNGICNTIINVLDKTLIITGNGLPYQILVS